MPQCFIPCSVCGEAQNFRLLWQARGNRGVPFIAKRHPVVLCKGCGLCFLNPQHSQADYRRYYQGFDRTPGKKVSPWGLKPQKRSSYDRLRLAFLTHFVPEKDKNIGDIGSGYGVFLNRLRELGYKNLTGIDPSAEASRVARTSFGFNVLNADLQTNVLPAAAFDVVTLIAVIEHFTDPVKGLKQIYALLRPGGYLYVNTPNLNEVIFRSGWARVFKFVHTFYFTEQSLRNCLNRAGFSIVASATLPADLRFSSWLLPENYSASELNILAQKPLASVGTSVAEIQRADWREIEERLYQAWRRDRFYNFGRRFFEIWQNRFLLGRLPRWARRLLLQGAGKPLLDAELIVGSDQTAVFYRAGKRR